MLKNQAVRNWMIGIVVVISVVAVGLRVFSPAAASPQANGPTEQVVSLEVAHTIEASGSLEAQPFASLSWKTGGVIQEVRVQPGDRVQEGEILAALQPASTSASIVSAQAELVNAQQDLDDLLNSDTELAQTVISLKDAREDYQDAVDYLDYLQSDLRIPQTINYVTYVQTPKGWEYKYKTRNTRGPAPEDWIVEAQNDLALKKAQYEDLQRTFDRLKDGPNAQDVLAAQAKVDAAQATINSLYILAPFAGQVLAVEAHAGDSVNTGTLALYVADMQQLSVEVQVDEADIASVSLGQPVDVELDALEGQAFTGQVTAINPVGEVVSGLVKYAVRIDLDPVQDQTFIPLGTTANVVIHVSAATAALAVPITTIQNDASGEFVMVLGSDGSSQRVAVTSGAIVDDRVVVSGDLQAGDRLLVNNGSSFQAPNPFSGDAQ